MRRDRIISLLIVFLALASAARGFEYQMAINDSLHYSGRTITVITIGENGVVFDVSGEKSTIIVGKPQNFGKLYIIPKEVFYVKEKQGRSAVIDFCEKSEESCNNIDDDCDGLIDDGVERKCGGTVGICSQGTQKCMEGEWGYCEGMVYPQDEICNGLDDDCDGYVDEDLSRACGNSPVIGECKNGVQQCINGSWSECGGQVFPKPERCNSKDDDCDGRADEGLVKTCGVSDVGECTILTASCKKGKWEECEAVMPVAEVCDGLDNDCDGYVDENLTRGCGETDVGICKFGTETCMDAKWSGCVGAVNPGTEWCDGLDNDCDGIADNGCMKKGVFSRVIGWFKGLFS